MAEVFRGLIHELELPSQADPPTVQRPDWRVVLLGHYRLAFLILAHCPASVYLSWATQAKITSLKRCHAARSGGGIASCCEHGQKHSKPQTL